MVVLTVTYVIQNGQEDRALEHFRALIRESRKEAGNREYFVHRSTEDPRRFLVYEQWVDQAALDEHRAAPHFQQHAIEGIRAIMESRTPETFELIE